MTNNLKTVALIDDVCGYGKCSLGILIPTISASGNECIPGVTSVYSTHTPIKNFARQDTTDILEDTISAWRRLNQNIDAIYTGALSNKDQAYLCLQLFADNPSSIKFVDPVLGDFGKFYDKNFERLLPHMKKLCSKSDIICPNITEAKLLTNTKHNDPEKLIYALKKLGAQNIILKGYVENGKIYNFLLNSKCALSKHGAKFYNNDIHGAGDFFIACVITHFVKYCNLKNSLNFATKITSNAVKFTISQADFKNKGIYFEPFLEQITNL